MDMWQRRRGLVASPFVCPYITDGLALYLDGIHKGGVKGAWTDLIGGLEFVNSGVTEIADGWLFTGVAGSHLYYPTEPIGAFPYDTCTIEVCASDVTSTKNMFIIGSVTNTHNICFFQEPGYGTALGNRIGLTWDMVNGGTFTASLNNVIALRNGEASSRMTSSNYFDHNGVEWWIGNRNSNDRLLIGTIHSIRIYSRKLSAAEMLNNQKVDNHRFGLGLTI